MSEEMGRIEPSRKREPRAPRAWPVFAALAATLAGTALSIWFGNRIAAEIDADSASIAGNASPSVEALAAARTEVLRIQSDGAVAVEALRSDEPVPPKPFDDARDRLRGDLQTYLSLPFYPNERDHWLEVQQGLARFYAAVRALESRLAAGDYAGAYAAEIALRPIAERTDGLIASVLDFNAAQDERLAREIANRRVEAARVTTLLWAITAALGLLLMAVVWGGIRANAAELDRARRRTAEHARAAEAFSYRLQALLRSAMSISEGLANSSGLEHVFQTIADSRDVIEADYWGIGRGTDPERPFDPWVVSGIPGDFRRRIGRAPRPVGVLGVVAHDRRTVRLDDVARSPDFRGLPEHHPPLGPLIGVPILRGGQSLASLFVARRGGAAPFDEIDQRIAELFASYAAIAIENFTLYERSVAATRAREELLATVSHDMKNPVNAIRLSAAVLGKTAPDDKAREVAARIDRSAARLQSLILNLLDAAKLEAGAFQPVRRPEPVAALIDEAVEACENAASAKKIRLVIRSPDAPVSVSCERDLVLRVLGNLLGNAIKFSADGASVTVGAETQPGFAAVRVEDEGAGMTAEQVQHAFDRYWQGRPNDRHGSGLGLFIAKGIVEAHGGSISIESAPAKGTTVRFTLPLAGTEA